MLQRVADARLDVLPLGEPEPVAVVRGGRRLAVVAVGQQQAVQPEPAGHPGATDALRALGPAAVDHHGPRAGAGGVVHLRGHEPRRRRAQRGGDLHVLVRQTRVRRTGVDRAGPPAPRAHAELAAVHALHQAGHGAAGLAHDEADPGQAPALVEAQRVGPRDAGVRRGRQGHEVLARVRVLLELEYRDVAGTGGGGHHVAGDECGHAAGQREGGRRRAHARGGTHQGAVAPRARVRAGAGEVSEAMASL